MKMLSLVPAQCPPPERVLVEDGSNPVFVETERLRKLGCGERVYAGKPQIVVGDDHGANAVQRRLLLVDVFDKSFSLILAEIEQLMIALD